MSEFLTNICEAVMDCLKKHGLIKTALTIGGLVFLVTLFVLAWQTPEIIRAIQGR